GRLRLPGLGPGGLPGARGGDKGQRPQLPPAVPPPGTLRPGGDKQEGKKPQPPQGKPKILAQFNPLMGFGLEVLDAGGNRQKITFPAGEVHSRLVFVMIDGKQYLFGFEEGGKVALFGSKEAGKLPPGVRGGRWAKMAEPLSPGPDGKPRPGIKSTWVAGDISVTQTVEVVRSEK